MKSIAVGFIGVAGAVFVPLLLLLLALACFFGSAAFAGLMALACGARRLLVYNNRR